MEETPGVVTIAPEVLVTIVQLTTQDVPGVYQMSTYWTRQVNRFFGNTRLGDGVQIHVDGNHVTIDLYIVVEPDANMLELARTIQAQVTRAIVEMVGMEVRAVNVHIDDVHYALEAS